MQTNRVSWGPVSSAVLLAFLGSLIPTVTEYVQRGELPTKEATISLLTLALFAAIRVGQQMLLDYLDSKFGGAMSPSPQPTGDMENVPS